MKRTIRIRKHRRKGKIVKAHARKIKRNYGMGLIIGREMRPQLHIGSKEINFPFQRGGALGKPENVLWTSTHTPKKKYKSDWDRHVKQEMPSRQTKESVMVRPKKDAKIYKIDNLDDLNKLYEQYPVNDKSNIPSVDWKKASKDLDAVQLTGPGQIRTRSPEIGDKIKPKHRGLDLYTWDAESTAWFNPAFSQEKKQ